MASEAMKTTHGKFDGDAIFSCAAMGKVQFWIGCEDTDIECNDIKLFGITQINDFPCNRTCEIICVTGRERHKWEDCIKIVEEWAAYNGCSLMELYARAGWKRVMNKYGYEETHTILNKHIGG